MNEVPDGEAQHEVVLPSPDFMRGYLARFTDGPRPQLADDLAMGWLRILIDEVELLRERVATASPTQLTEREAQTYRYLLGVAPYLEVAKALGVSLDTMKTHQRAVYRKMGVRTRDELRRVARARDDH